MKLKAAIFFGGPSRERGRSFVKAKCVFQKLDQSLFEPLVFFIDIKLQLYQCDPSILYHQNIKALFGASSDGFTLYQESLQNQSELQQQEIYWKIGRLIQPDLLPQLINIAFVETWADEQVDAWLLRHLIDHRIPYIGVAAEVRQVRAHKSRFFGLQNAVYPLILTVSINVVNIILSYLMVHYWGWGVAGVAYGTLIAQYFGLVVALGLFFYKYGNYVKEIRGRALLNGTSGHHKQQ